MKITLDFGDMTYEQAQTALGMDDNFDLTDSIIYTMDYDYPDKDGLIHDSHNGIKITVEGVER